ncbi:ABC transporter permease [Bradyrhizobium sp. CCGUVB1N3]|uniref:ABC transporter permease n=1 Tax=Bradyrhizobium sp. CCGUVB1N3 TaxID=2949629 RepID=UPI0020B2BDC4|nr:ABC transporter permease [Bradyrhizobium sp. CCGUVB1N3]MCP3476731.1 ABC transporter permease [Bradyrhizobium sp. CCGUVB1N3]
MTTLNDAPPSRPRRLRVVLEVRLDMPVWARALVSLAAVVFGLVVSAIILALAGVAPSSLVTEFGSTLADPGSLRAVLSQSVPLILVGIAASVAFRARFWNLGLEGQMIMGGIAATAISLHQIGAESIRIELMALAAMLGGIIWVALPMAMKYLLGINEIIATLLLNYIAQYALYDLLFGAWKDPADSFPHSGPFSAAERLPVIGEWLQAGMLVAVVVVAATFWLLQVSRAGFYLRFIYANTSMAHRMGVPTGRIVAIVVLASGAIAGLAGFVIPSGIEGRLTQGYFEGYGFSGVLIAFLAQNNPLSASVVAILVAVLFVVGQSLQIFYQIPFSMVQLIQAIIVMSVAGADFFVRHRLILQR